MNSDLAIFVEGKSDEVFLRCLLHHIGLCDANIIPIGGGISKLEAAKPAINRACDKASRTAIILDADDSAPKTRRKFLGEKNRLWLPIQHFFLLPNGNDSGCLETLLKGIPTSPHDKIYKCFDAYENCLRNAQSNYIVPNPKARIYAYCEALGIETNANERDYGDHWDLNSPILQPLKNFLRSL